MNLALNQIQVGQTTQATAVARDVAGNVLPGRPTTWQTGQSSIASVSGNGLVLGSSMGGTTVSATIEGRIGQTAITIGAPSSFGGGTRMVGVSIGAGLYRSNNLTSGFCYWERLSGFGGTGAEIIANGLGGGPAVVAIAASDKGFSSSGCVTWVLVTGGITASQTAPFPAGTFIVGTDIASGTWQTNGAGGSCYWERLRGFSGEGSDIIANDFGTPPAIVTISPSDKGFGSSGCGTWVKIG